eukprot:7221454-Alexandrium_andersonii.AAC.1
MPSLQPRHLGLSQRGSAQAICQLTKHASLVDSQLLGPGDPGGAPEGAKHGEGGGSRRDAPGHFL